MAPATRKPLTPTPQTHLEIRRVPLATLVPDPANVRTHDERNIAAIRASLQRFGQVEPLLVHRSTRRIVAGHGRLQAMLELGWIEAQIVEVDFEPTEATALAIALNRTGELAGWDEPALAKILATLRAEDALLETGFSEKDLEDLLRDLGESTADPTVEDPGPQAPSAEAISRRGDLWLLGDHRLLCGDSTIAADVDRVMAGDRAALCATDSPYLVDYVGHRPNGSGKDWSDVYHEVDIEDADTFFRSVMTNIKRVLAPHSAIYWWHAHKRCGEIQRIWKELGFVDHQQIIWAKPSPVFGFVFWHFQHEPCMVGWVQGSKPQHDGQHEFSSVWSVDWSGKARHQSDHPTSKPVELFARPIRKHTAAGDIVFEPFCGSGSGLIAAEQERRRCRAIEIEPVFVDVIIRRWQLATGKSARLEGDGREFDTIAKERGAP